MESIHPNHTTPGLTRLEVSDFGGFNDLPTGSTLYIEAEYQGRDQGMVALNINGYTFYIPFRGFGIPSPYFVPPAES